MQPKMKAEGHDFPISCIGILADLWSKDGITQKELGSSMIKNKSSVTKMLEALEESELIEKREDETDKRKKLIFLTEKGHQFRKMMESKTLQYQTEILPNHTPEELEITKKVLKTMYLNLKEKVKTKDLK